MPKDQKPISKVFLKSNEDKPELIDLTDEQYQVNEKRQPELVIDLTAEHENQIIELDKSLDFTVYNSQKKISKESLKNSDKKPELIIDLTEDEEKTFDSMVQACKNGQLGTLDANLKEVSHDTLLHDAAENGQLEIVTQLLKNEPLSYFLNKSHFTPLHLASINGHTQVVKELLKYWSENQP